MIKDFRKTKKLKNIKNGQFSFILKFCNTVISNCEKLTHPNIQYIHSVRYRPLSLLPCFS